MFLTITRFAGLGFFAFSYVLIFLRLSFHGLNSVTDNLCMVDIKIVERTSVIFFI